MEPIYAMFINHKYYCTVIFTAIKFLFEYWILVGNVSKTHKTADCSTFPTIDWFMQTWSGKSKEAIDFFRFHFMCSPCKIKNKKCEIIFGFSCILLLVNIIDKQTTPASYLVCFNGFFIFGMDAVQ